MSVLCVQFRFLGGQQLHGDGLGGKRAADVVAQIPYSEKLDGIQILAHEWGRQLTGWKRNVANIRRRFPFLNFFTATEAWRQLRLLDMGIIPIEAAETQELCGFLQSCNRSFTREQAVQAVTQWLTKAATVLETKETKNFGLDAADSSVEMDRLANLGEFLTDFFAFIPECPPREVPFGDKRTAPSVRPGVNLFSAQPGFLENTITKIFAERGRLPEPDEVLICSPTTSVERIHCLFLRCMANGEQRARFAEDRDRKISLPASQDRVFVLAAVEQLPPLAQREVANLLDEMFLSYQARTNNAAAQHVHLAVVSAAREQDACLLAHHLSDQRTRINYMQKAELVSQYSKTFHAPYDDEKQRERLESWDKSKPLVRL